MEHSALLLLVASISGLLLFGCSAIQPSSPKEIRLSEKDGDCGSTVELNTGDTLLLILEGNPTTGYTWEIESNDPAVIKPDGKPEFNSESEAIGAGGTYTFRFNAVAKGQVTLKLVYHRSFEANMPALKSCELTIKVK
ncbi:MAG TPA: protease inhibitor I42 family protein [Anaerolineales bacterium]|nr:protease inhibitor I42 family protein [Anaerolineales bacterium]